MCIVPLSGSIRAQKDKLRIKNAGIRRNCLIFIDCNNSGVL